MSRADLPPLSVKEECSGLGEGPGGHLTQPGEGEGSREPLLEFASIAIGPQSPLHAPADWGRFRSATLHFATNHFFFNHIVRVFVNISLQVSL
jgi:hypothetical protein